jgi:hypothetical protein
MKTELDFHMKKFGHTSSEPSPSSYLDDSLLGIRIEAICVDIGYVKEHISQDSN